MYHILGHTKVAKHHSTTYFQYNGVIYKQISDLPVAPSLSGLLSIMYIYKLKRIALSTSDSSIFFSRYVEDIYTITSSRVEVINIHRIFNKIVKHASNSRLNIQTNPELSLHSTFKSGSQEAPYLSGATEKPLASNRSSTTNQPYSPESHIYRKFSSIVRP